MKNHRRGKVKTTDRSDKTKQCQRIIVYCCEASAYKAVQPLLTDANYNWVEFVKVACTGLIGVSEILKSFEKGTSSVIVAGCPPGSCRHTDGSSRAAVHVTSAVKELSEAMLDEYRVRMCFASSVDTRKIEQVIQEEIRHDSGRT